MKIFKYGKMILAGLLVLCLCIPAVAAEVPSEETAVDAYEMFDEVSEGIDTIREIHFNVTYVEDPDVVAYIERMKKNPKIQQTVQEEATDPEAWWRWFDSMPVETARFMNQKEAMEWLERFSTIPREERSYLSYNLLRLDVKELMAPTIYDAPEGYQGIKPFAEEIDLGAGFLPVGGWEHKFDFIFWHEDKKRLTANCYLYSLNTYADGVNYQSVGYASQGKIPTMADVYANFDKYLKEDAPHFNNKIIVRTTATAKPGYGQYKIVGVMCKGWDFHFYRQDSDGYWSHKMGYNDISQYDAAGIKILNPANCNRNYGQKYNNYSSFMGYYMVTYKR